MASLQSWQGSVYHCWSESQCDIQLYLYACSEEICVNTGSYFSVIIMMWTSHQNTTECAVLPCASDLQSLHRYRHFLSMCVAGAQISDLFFEALSVQLLLPFTLNSANSPLLFPGIRHGLSHISYWDMWGIVCAAIRPDQAHVVSEFIGCGVGIRVWRPHSLLPLAWKFLLDGAQVHRMLDDLEVVWAFAVLDIHRLQEWVGVFLYSHKVSGYCRIEIGQSGMRAHVENLGQLVTQDLVLGDNTAALVARLFQA